MMTHRTYLLVLLIVSAHAPRTAQSAPPRVYRDSVRPHWFAGKTRFWYRNDLKGGAREFVVINVKDGSRQPAFDHAHVAAAIAHETGAPVTADKLGIDRLDFSDDGQNVVLHGRGRAWRLDLATHKLVAETSQGAIESSLEPIGSLRPTRFTGDETALTFINRTNGPVGIYWVDTEGQRHHYETVPPGGQHQQHTYAGHVWLVTERSGRPIAVFEANTDRSTAVIDQAVLTRSLLKAVFRPRSRLPRLPVASPDGKWIAFIKDHNLYLRDVNTGAEFSLSADGKPSAGYGLESVKWSPDSQKLTALRTEAAQEHKVHFVESSPAGQVQPRLHTFDYLKPGDRIAHPRPQLFHVATRKQIAIDESLFSNPWSIGDVRWSADSKHFTFVYNQRGHQVLRVIAIDAVTGAARAIIDERSDTFICYSGKYFCEWIGDGEILWMSERGGSNHLWLVDAVKGVVKSQVTKGDWVVQSVTHVDHKARTVWFRAGGIRPGQDPYYSHFCRAQFDGTGLVVLTEGAGDHRVQWSPGDSYFIDTWSRVDQPPITELRSSDDGRLICRLEEADASEVLALRGRFPEPFVAKGRDGKTDIFGMVILPRDFDASRKYPVVESIYAGPQGFFTPKAFRPDFGRQQELADRGIIVVQCDGMGTSGRSKAFHDVCWRNLRDAGLPDRIAWIRAAAAKLPQMDLSRVGIYGGSAGGQNALAALLWHGDFYKVAVADCGCHDNRMDKIWWNEQWLGWPVGKHYEENSNVVNAHRLSGKLMLIVGEMDRNVDPASTMQVVRALERANKDFDLVVMAGVGHGAADTPYGARRRADFLARHLIADNR